MVYEVFRQERKGQPFQHAGSVTAPDEQFAEIYAREQYGRRQESVALWLVPREAVSEIDEFPDEFEMKYRRVDGYSIKARLHEARERAGTLDMAPGASGVSERTELLLAIADDELVLGWRNSEWTGIAPFLEEDVAFSSIAQNEIGHARALYAARRGRARARPPTSWRSTARPSEYRCAPLVQPRLVHDWAGTIARHFLYETADAIRLDALKSSDDGELAGLAAKMDREEVYHRMHAEMWAQRLRDEDRFRDALDAHWPSALGVLDEELRPRLVERVHEARLRAGRRRARRAPPRTTSSSRSGRR